MHSKSICHRDIKCANVFLTKAGVVKLGDMNVSRVVKGGMMRTQIPKFRLPESVLVEEVDRILDLGVELRAGQKIESLKALLAESGVGAVLGGIGGVVTAAVAQVGSWFRRSLRGNPNCSA